MPRMSLHASLLARRAATGSLPHAILVGLLGIAGIAVHMLLGSDLAGSRRLALLFGAEPEVFADIQFLYAELPRLVLALAIGGALGLCGSVMQQATQNRLVSPLTVGTASGAWAALVAASIWFPEARAAFGAWIAMGGAGAALALVIFIAGPAGIAGLPVILGGMAVHILLASVANAMILLNEQTTQSLFIWGAGDLTQTDWQWVTWLLPKLAVGAALFALAPRGLALMRLGPESAAARGLPVVPFVAALLLCCLWLSASSIAAVGMIGFIALLAPNIARLGGASGPAGEMAFALAWGAILLVLTDAIALMASRYSVNLVPSGAAAALVGAPALILLASRRLKASDHSHFTLPRGAAELSRWRVAALGLALIGLSVVNLTLGQSEDGWILGMPSGLLADLRWPRLVAAGAGGAGMALAGAILQRLVRNPLASPDILGVTSGAALALVIAALFMGGTIRAVGPLAALAGSGAVLGLLVLFGRRHGYAPAFMVLVGISLAALSDALVQFALSSGDDRAYAIINWMSGSTYRVDADAAVSLAIVVALLGGLAFALRRWLSLISIGDGIAAARGLAVGPARLLLLVVACALTAAVTALMGRVAFVGLLAPQLAAVLGARNAREQITVSMTVGAAVMICADWLGRTIIYPYQLPAGSIASMVGGVYFLLLLVRSRLQPGSAD